MRKRDYKVWDYEKKKFLKENYDKYSNGQLAEMFDTTVRAIDSIALRLDLKKSKQAKNRIISEGHIRAYAGKSRSDKYYGGYKHIYMPDHIPNNHGYVCEHTLVMEKKLGRRLTETEKVIRKDGNKLNNDPDNLEIFDKNRNVPVDQLIADRKSGMKVRDIVKKYSISIEHYYDIIKLAGYPVKKIYLSATDDEIWKSDKENYDVDKFCKEHKISRFTYNKRLKSLKFREFLKKLELNSGEDNW